MAESVVRSCTSSANGVEKQRASRRSARAKQPAGRRGLLRAGESPLFAELARLAEMSLLERRLRSLGFRAIAGTDEVGRGCLAGPVVAAAVILPGEHFPGVNDSKLLSHAERVSRCHFILKHAVAVAIGIVEAHVIDQINILRASKAAMLHAVENLSTRPDVLLLDAVALDDLEMPQVPLIEGDRRSVSIAAASIVAKVYRDSLMQSYHEIYPRYNFINNRGYGTEDHWRALHEFGPTPIHRLSFQGVDEEMELFPG